MPGLLRQRAHQAQHDLLQHRLDRGGQIHVTLLQSLLRTSRWPTEQRVEALVRHRQAGAIVEIVEVQMK